MSCDRDGESLVWLMLLLHNDVLLDRTGNTAAASLPFHLKAASGMAKSKRHICTPQEAQALRSK